MMKYIPWILAAAALVAFVLYKRSGGGTVVLGATHAPVAAPNDGRSQAQGPPYAAPAGFRWEWMGGYGAGTAMESEWKLQSLTGAWQPGVLQPDLSIS